MATPTSLPWRFDSTVPPGETNPDVTVYFGDVFTNDGSGQKVLQHSYTKTMIVKLADLPALLANPVFVPPETATMEVPPPPFIEGSPMPLAKK